MSGPKIIDTAALRTVERLRLRALCAQLESAISRCNVVIEGLAPAARYGFELFESTGVEALRGQLESETLVELRDASTRATGLLADVREIRKHALVAAVEWRAREQANGLALGQMAAMLSERADAHPEALELVRQAEETRDFGEKARLLERASSLCEDRQEASGLEASATVWLAEIGNAGSSRFEAPLSREQREMMRLLAEVETLEMADREGFAQRLREAGAVPERDRALALDSLRIELAERARFLRKRELRREILEEWRARAADSDFEAGALMARLEDTLEDEGDSFERIASTLEEAYGRYVERMSAAAARAAILGALGELGYEVREGMARAWSEEGKVYLSKPTGPGYALELATTETKATRLRTRLVRTGGSIAETPAERQRDKEEEVRWCAEREALSEALAGNDIEVTVRAARAAGEEPMEVMTDAAETRRGESRRAGEREQR